ncbi:MAG: hypothetical protein ACRETB_07785 [Steroidobacteraceae bacterium]
MQLTDGEQAMLDGRAAPARRKAPELLVRYAEALEIITTGDWVVVDADRGVVEIHKTPRST